jgi:hypothetical protein
MIPNDAGNLDVKDSLRISNDIEEMTCVCKTCHTHTLEKREGGQSSRMTGMCGDRVVEGMSKEVEVFKSCGDKYAYFIP